MTKNVTDVEHSQKRYVWVRTPELFEHERLGAHRVDEVVLHILQVNKKHASPCSNESIKINIWMSYKYKTNIAIRDGDRSWQSKIKSMQNENVPETNGENNNGEGRMVPKSKIVKMNLKYVSFLATRNRHARETIGNVVRTLQSN